MSSHIKVPVVSIRVVISIEQEMVWFSKGSNVISIRFNSVNDPFVSLFVSMRVSSNIKIRAKASCTIIRAEDVMVLVSMRFNCEDVADDSFENELVSGFVMLMCSDIKISSESSVVVV